MHVSGTARSGRYYVIVHFYQPNHLSFLGKVVVSGQGAASVLLTFHYCPYVSGCRAVGTSQYRERMIDSVYIGRQSNILISIVIPEDKGVWIVSGLEIRDQAVLYLSVESTLAKLALLSQPNVARAWRPAARVALDSDWSICLAIDQTEYETKQN